MTEKTNPNKQEPVKHSKDWLVNGKVPANSVCPFRAICGMAKSGDCKHTGTAHNVPFSCGAARAYNMTQTF